MTREEAERRVAELSREHPDRGTVRWLARERKDGWEVARVTLPGSMRIDPLKGVVEAKPRPPEAPDPRSPLVRNVGGPYGL